MTPSTNDATSKLLGIGCDHSTSTLNCIRPHQDLPIPQSLALCTTPTQCFEHPSSRARAQSPLPATSPHPLCAWLRELPALAHRDLPELLAGKQASQPQLPPSEHILTVSIVTPSPSARLLPRSSTFVKKRRPSTLTSVPWTVFCAHRITYRVLVNILERIADGAQASGNQGEAQAAEGAHGRARQAHFSDTNDSRLQVKAD